MRPAIGLGAAFLSTGLPLAHSFAGSLPSSAFDTQASRWVSSTTRPSFASKHVLPLASSVSGASSDVASFVGYDTAVAQAEASNQELTDGSVLSNSALVAGNMVGAGVLALPAVTSAPGFLLSSIAMVLVWGYCLASGVLVAECAGDGRDSIQEMAEASVGRTAGNVMCGAFLASNYLLMVAYICQGASLLSGLPMLSPEVCGPLFSSCVADWHLAPVLFTALVGGMSLWGNSRFVENANTALVGLIGLSFAGLMATGLPHVDVMSLGLIPDASALPAMLPVAVCGLTFQNVVPAVSKNLNGDVKKIRSSLAIGSGLPLLTYILWNAVVLGSTGGLGAGLASVPSPMDALASTSPTLGLLVAVFSMSAIITSFWGASFSLMIECTHLVEALASSGSLWDTKGQFPMADDARSIDEMARHDENVKAAAATLVLVPPAMVSLACPDSFLAALQYVGVYIDPFLYGLAPAIMAYRLRSSETHKTQMPGGAAALAFVATLTCGYTAWQTFLMNA